MTRVTRLLKLEEGWLAPLLLLLIILLPVFSLNEAEWVDGTEGLLVFALLAALLAIIFAKSAVSRYLAMPLGLLGGLLATYVGIGGILPSMQSMITRLLDTPAWLLAALQNKPVGVDPITPMVSDILSHNDLLAGRLWEWFVVGTAGGSSSDNLVFLLLLGIVVWGVAFWSAWHLYRYHNALMAVMPTGVFLVVNGFLSNRGMGYVVIYVVATLILLMGANLAGLERSWRRKSIDFSTELNFDLTVFTVEVTAVLAIGALLLPTLKANPVASTYWIYVSRPWGEVESAVNRLFSGLNNPNPDLGTGSKGAFVLGGSFNRDESSPIYMYVQTNETILTPAEARSFGEEDAATPPSHYWRGETWDLYTGRGWDHSEKVAVDRPAGEPVIDYTIASATPLRQDFEIVTPRADILFAANQPQVVEQPYRYMALGNDDFSALYLRRTPLSAVKYTVTSTVPLLGIEDLRRSPAEYPEWVKQRYLQLPKLPERVTSLAQEIVSKAGAQTPYDKAMAIQTYLRQLPYDPNIKLPTGNYDAVDYFLFIQKGYCDYFGTVMSVMLRSVGVPARLATGYLGGSYDYAKTRYEVSERDGHAWTEVYFPPFGWIEFEPTPGKAPIQRPAGSMLAEFTYTPPDVAPLAQPGFSLFNFHFSFDLSFLRAVPVLLAVAALVALLWSIWPLLERRLVTSRFIVTIYGRMCRYAAWAGLPKPLAATPKEYAHRLSESLATAPAQPLVWRKAAPASVPVPASEHIAVISNAFVETQYSPHPLTDERRTEVIAAWQSVKGRIWSLLAARTVRRAVDRVLGRGKSV